MATTTPAGEVSRAEAPSQPAGTCPRCGAAFTEDQEYCLECGLRLPVPSGAVWRLRTGWGRRLRWYPGDWLWPVLLFALLAAAGAAAAIVLPERRETSQTLVATSPPGETTGLAPASTTPTTPTIATVSSTGTVPAGGRRTTTATTAPSPPPPPPKQTKALGWPTARRGYTVVLASVPLARGRDAAVAQADRAMSDGLEGVGILNSSSYSSLHPGYYVIFTGIRDSEDATARDLSAAQAAGYTNAYVRQITP